MITGAAQMNGAIRVVSADLLTGRCIKHLNTCSLHAKSGSHDLPVPSPAKALTSVPIYRNGEMA
jgi:hypothetical protein